MAGDCILLVHSKHFRRATREESLTGVEGMKGHGILTYRIRVGGIRQVRNKVVGIQLLWLQPEIIVFVCRSINFRSLIMH